MPYCATCRENKKKIYFDIEKAREAAKQLAIEKQETYAIYREGRAVAFTTAATAREQGYTVIELLSKYL